MASSRWSCCSTASTAWGARRERLEVKLFGGARVVEGLSDIGMQNADFAEKFLLSEGIRQIGGSLRGDRARRVQFWPVSGRVRQMAVADPGRTVFEAERSKPRPREPAAQARGGAVLMQRDLAQVLRAVALEMAALAQEAERLQALAGALMRDAADAAAVEDAQALDALTQRLSALAGFLARIGEDAPEDWRLDIAPALAGVTLSDLAARIGHPVATSSQAVAPTGECELF